MSDTIIKLFKKLFINAKGEIIYTRLSTVLVALIALVVTPISVLFFMSDKFAKFFKLFTNATGETLYMSLSAALIAALVGIPLGVLLFVTRKEQFLANSVVNVPLGIIVNIGRSIPFIILVVSIIPFTRFIAGTFIGNTAMIVPLTISAIPFVARLTENVLNEVPSGLVEAAQSMGASPFQIIRKVLLAESRSGLVNALTVTTIALVGYSAMAGAVGAGGLGKVGISYGYQRFNSEIMIYTVIILVILVQIMQSFGDYLATKLDHR